MIVYASPDRKGTIQNERLTSTAPSSVPNWARVGDIVQKGALGVAIGDGARHFSRGLSTDDLHTPGAFSSTKQILSPVRLACLVRHEPCDAERFQSPHHAVTY